MKSSWPISCVNMELVANILETVSSSGVDIVTVLTPDDRDSHQNVMY